MCNLVEVSERAFRVAIEFLEGALDFHHRDVDADGTVFWYLDDGSLVAEEILEENFAGHHLSAIYKVHPKLRDVTGYRVGPMVRGDNAKC